MMNLEITGFANDENLDPEIRRIGIAAFQLGLATPLEVIECAVRSKSDSEFVELIAAAEHANKSLLVELRQFYGRAGISPEDCLAEFFRRMPNQDTVECSPDPSINADANILIKAQTASDEGTFGHFRLSREVAKGGMGVVYDAIDTKLDRRVALKLILGGNLADDNQRKRFFAEAESAAKLSHEHIVKVYDIGTIDDHDYMSLAFVDGQSLYDLAGETPISSRRAAKLMCQVADAVQYAHDSGIIHRDLKPHNILVGANKVAKVTDFGLARNTTGDSNLTTAGQVIGTPSYMPPEQAAGDLQAIDAVSDVYSLGASLYFLLTGRAPFQSENAIQTMAQVLTKEPVSIRMQNRSVPRNLETICLKCLRKQKKGRYQSAAELREDLTRWLNDEPIVARRVSKLEKSILWTRRNPIYPIVFVGLLLAALVGWKLFAGQAEIVEQEKLIDRLATADISQLEPILDQINPADRQFSNLLQTRLDLAVAENNTNQELRYRLALLRYFTDQSGEIEHFLTSCSLVELGVIANALARYGDVDADDYWRVVKHQYHSAEKRARCMAVLAAVDPDSEKWEECLQLGAEYVVQLPASNVAQWTKLFSGHNPKFDAALFTIFRDRHRDSDDYGVSYDIIRRDAESLILRRAVDRYRSEFELFVYSKGSDYKKYFDLLAKNKARFGSLCREEIAKPRVPCRDQPYDYQSIRKANCHLALFQLEQGPEIWEQLKFTPDPTVRNYLIKLFSEQNPEPGLLLERLKIETDNTVTRALLLALSNYRYDVFDEPKRSEAQQVGIDLYKNNPDAGVHGAAGYLIGVWWSANDIPHLDQQIRDEVLINENPKRGEWTMSPSGVTQVAVGPDSYLMGRQQDDYGFHLNCIEQHRRVIPRKILVATHPVTFSEYRIFAKEVKIETVQDTSPDNYPAVCNFYGAAQYCNWLSKQEGIPEVHWCYLPNEDGNYAAGMRTAPDFLNRMGYRLPTEGEWECFCRAGTTSKYHFGECYFLRNQYLNTSRNRFSFFWGKPNELGLLDLTSWKFEWCNDNSDPNREIFHFPDGFVDQVGAIEFDDHQYCVARGFSYADLGFHSARHSRSDYRIRGITRLFEETRIPSLNRSGFRVIRTIESATESSEAMQ